MRTIHYLSHTHWDREWLRSSDASRIKLVYLFDHLITMMQQDENYAYFTFDGQTAAIEDYLTIKPDQRESIQQLVTAKRLFIGPWYTQPDMFLVSGESLLRNLLIGSRIAEGLGHCMEVGWIPDAFGQIEKTPQLFAAIGSKAIFVWRGFDYDKIDDSIFLWDSEQGQSMLSVHFPLGYGYYRYLPREQAKAIADIRQHVEASEHRFKDDEPLLFMGGSDYAHPQKELPAILKDCKCGLAEAGYTIKLSNPEAYIADVKAALSHNKRRLQHYQGEARSAALGRIHAGIHSTRMDSKNQMKYFEILISQIVEPMTRISHHIGGECAQEMITYYWKILFKNQFHDSAYNSSPESVNQSVENRLLQLRHGLNELIWMNFRYLQTHLDLSALRGDEDLLVLYNTLPYQRDDLVFISMIVEKDTFLLMDHKERVIPYVKLQQEIDVNCEIEYYNGILNFHDGGDIQVGSKKRVQLLCDAKDVPAMGYQAYKVCYTNTTGVQVVGDVRRTQDRTFENKYLQVHIHANGSLAILDKETKLTYDNVHYFEERGDDGDEYNYSPPLQEDIQTTLQSTANIQCVEESPWMMQYRIDYVIKTPRACVEHKRTKEMVESTITTYVSLCKNAHRIDFYTVIENHASDHRIRAIFPDRQKAKRNISQDCFGITKRWNAIQKQKGIQNGASEEELPIYPMQRFVKLDHDQGFFAIISKGPCEYEVYQDQKIALTLLRSVGKFGKSDLAIRPGRSSGYRLDTPSSQLLKKVTNSYSLFIKKDASIQELARQTNRVNTQVQSRYLNQLQKARNDGYPWRLGTLAIGEGMEVMAYKKSEDGDDDIIRLLNTCGSVLVGARIQVSTKVLHCYVSDVKEQQKQALRIREGWVTLPDIMPQSFLTLRLKR